MAWHPTQFDLAGAARIRAALEAQGTPIGPIDTLIAGTAIARGATLVTRNLREFNACPDSAWKTGTTAEAQRANARSAPAGK